MFTKNALIEIITLLGWGLLLLAGLDLALSLDPYHTDKLNAPVLASLGILILLVGHRLIKD